MATWKPLIASRGAKAVGRTWSIITIDSTGKNQYAPSGTSEELRVWAYRGRPVYTFSRDTQAGDMYGQRLGSFVGWAYAMLRADGDGVRALQ